MRHRWKILFGIATVFVLLTGIELVTIGNGPQKEVEAYKKSLIAKGEKLDISELVPPPVPSEQNGADIINQALGMLTPEDNEDSNSIPAMMVIAPGKAIVGFEQPEVRNWHFTNSWENELAVVEDDRPVTELLGQVMDYPAIDFHLNYKDWPTLDTIWPLVFAVGRLSAEAMCHLHQGDVGSAGTNISTVLAIVKDLSNEQFEQIQDIRISLARSAADATWELLQSSNVSDEELSWLQDNWEGQEFIHAMENAVAMERAKFELEILKMRASDEYFNEVTREGTEDVDWSDGLRDTLDGVSHDAKFAYAKSMYRASWTYSDELRMLQEHEILLQTLRTVETNQFFFPAFTVMTNKLSAYETDDSDDWPNKWDDNDLRRMFSAQSSELNPVRQITEAEATRRLVVTAIALKRYQLRHGNYPSSLADLAPQFVSSVPRDPIDGKPLRYRLMPDGSFLLYSIGENDKDDGGDGSMPRKTSRDRPPRITNPDALDWVWPQPATPAEIQAFYAHPPSP